LNLLFTHIIKTFLQHIDEIALIKDNKNKFPVSVFRID